MPGRFPVLTPPALLLAACAILLSPARASAHRLEADYRVLPGGKVQIESWFDLSGDSPKGAEVEVFGADGRRLAQGLLDDKGIYVFSVSKAEALRVVVSAGLGHRKELPIPAADLEPGVADGPSSTGKAEPEGDSPRVPLVDRSSRVSIKDVLVGVGFVLALAAFVLSLRNARQLRELLRRDRPIQDAEDTRPRS